MATKPRDQATPAAVETTAELPRLGTVVQVKLPDPTLKLINNETGQYFHPTDAVPVNVTTTIRRRLQHGDLVLA